MPRTSRPRARGIPWLKVVSEATLAPVLPCLWVALLLGGCTPTANRHRPAATITMLGSRYAVSQIERQGDWAYFTVVYSDTVSHRYFASCSRATYGGMEWPTAPQRDPRVAIEPSDTVLFKTLCG